MVHRGAGGSGVRPRPGYDVKIFRGNVDKQILFSYNKNKKGIYGLGFPCMPFEVNIYIVTSLRHIK